MTDIEITPFHTVFFTCLGISMLLMLALVLLVTWRFRFWVQCIAFLIGTLIVWFGLVLGTHYGYGAWQSMPDAPDRAFVDGAQLTGSVLFGWMPAGLATFAWWYTVRIGLFAARKITGARRHQA